MTLARAWLSLLTSLVADGGAEGGAEPGGLNWDSSLPSYQMSDLTRQINIEEGLDVPGFMMNACRRWPTLFM